MTQSTRIFLVFLRLVIGWHFLFEGLEKVKTHELATADVKKPWSSEVYLRESSMPGPIGRVFHWLPGDPLLERLTVVPLGENQDPAQVPPDQRFPPALDKDWRAYFERFVAHYGIEGEQRTRAEASLDQSKATTVQWLTSGVKAVKKAAPSGSTAEVDRTTPQRIDEYQAAVEKVHETEATDVSLFGSAANDKLKTAKADAAKLRSDLQADLDEQTAAMKSKLQDVLTTEQKAEGLVPGPDVRRWQDYGRLDWIDFLTRWGLVAVGLCLLLGLFTRPACLLGAGYLLLFFLAMPALPGLPENPRSEGHYLFINKNIIEMVALLALATTHSGRWAGLDGLFQFLNPWRWRRPKTAAVRVAGPVPSSKVTTRA